MADVIDDVTGRLGPGRIHHCMRLLGQAERSLSLMCARTQERTAFGKKLSAFDTTMEKIAKARCEIEMCRFVCLRRPIPSHLRPHGVEQRMPALDQQKTVHPNEIEPHLPPSPQISTLMFELSGNALHCAHCRLLVCQAAHNMDTLGNRDARTRSVIMHTGPPA